MICIAIDGASIDQRFQGNMHRCCVGPPPPPPPWQHSSGSFIYERLRYAWKAEDAACHTPSVLSAIAQQPLAAVTLVVGDTQRGASPCPQPDAPTLGSVHRCYYGGKARCK